MTTLILILFHITVFYFIGVFLAYGYIDLNNKFESRRDKNNVVFGQPYKEYYIGRRNSLKSFYFFFEWYVLKKY